jgi:hypothetical protein
MRTGPFDHEKTTLAPATTSVVDEDVKEAEQTLRKLKNGSRLKS